jgi:hypothetical protein
MEHFNKLTPAEHERLTLLMEECGEVVQIIGKILRHGYESRHPNGGPNNRFLLEKECGHIKHAMKLMCKSKDLEKQTIDDMAYLKADDVKRYLHHQ